MRRLNAALIACLLGMALPALADSQRPEAITDIRASGESGPAIAVSWSRPADNVGIDGYNLYRDGSYYKTIFGSTRYTDTNVSAGREYRYSVVAFDKARNYATRGEVVNAVAGGSDSSGDSSGDTSGDTSGGSAEAPKTTSNSKPSPPDNLRADVQSSSSAELTWSTPDGGAEGFNIYKNGSYFTTVKGRNDYTARSLTSGRTYSFEVVAFRNNQYSSKSSSVAVQTGSDSASSPPPPNDQEPASASDNADSAVPDNYELVFSDEFDRSSIDSSKWNTSYRWGADFIINNEAQYYVDSQREPDFGVTPFRLGGGELTIEATKTPDWLRDDARGQRYLSGAMTTFNKFEMKYGYVEMRARLPKGQGLWPAFWLLHGANSSSRPEIDVVEMLGDNTRLVYQTYHYYDNWNLVSTPSFQAPGPDYSSDFHTFGMLWEPGKIKWYVDGKETNRYVSSKVSSESMYILMNLALGGSWAGNPDSSTSFPAKFEIDYVRAYQAR